MRPPPVGDGSADRPAARTGPRPTQKERHAPENIRHHHDPAAAHPRGGLQGNAGRRRAAAAGSGAVRRLGRGCRHQAADRGPGLSAGLRGKLAVRPLGQRSRHRVAVCGGVGSHAAVGRTAHDRFGPPLHRRSGPRGLSGGDRARQGIPAAPHPTRGAGRGNVGARRAAEPGADRADLPVAALQRHGLPRLVLGRDPRPSAHRRTTQRDGGRRAERGLSGRLLDDLVRQGARPGAFRSAVPGALPLRAP